MKKKEKQSLHGMSDIELVKRIAELQAEIAKGKFGRKVRVKRKEIAVAKTVLAMRHI